MRFQLNRSAAKFVAVLLILDVCSMYAASYSDKNFRIDVPANWKVEYQDGNVLVWQRGTDKMTTKYGVTVRRGAALVYHEDCKEPHVDLGALDQFIGQMYPGYRQTRPEYADDWRNVKNVPTYDFTKGAIPFPGELRFSILPLPSGGCVQVYIIFDGPGESPEGIAASMQSYHEMRDSIKNTFQFNRR